jgi:hypothetical protein
MKSTQAWGWLAAGVLALGLNGIYHDGGAAWAHRAVDRVIGQIAERTAPVLALASGRIEWFLSKSGTALAQNEVASRRWATGVARLQSNVAGVQRGLAQMEAVSAREEARFGRQQAQLARMEANRARMEARMASMRISDVKVDVTVPVVCPRIRVNIPRVKVTSCSW